MKYLTLISLLLVLSLNLSCDDLDDKAPCSTGIVPGLRVDVADSATAAVITDGVTVTATDGDYEETLELSGVSFEGADERSATYVITVTKAGYQTFVSSPVHVPHNECHVITIPVTVQLVAE